jgi:putative DNA primase/helicase
VEGGAMMDLRSTARALGGEVVGRGILCPGPNHSRKDRSLSILFDASAPGGFTLHSHAGDDFGECRDFVRDRLGLTNPKGHPAPSLPRPIKHDNVSHDPSLDRTALALRIWRETRQPSDSPVARYLDRRGLDLVDDVHEVLRFHPGCPFAGARTPAMVALVRNVVTNQPQAIHRTALNLEGQKVEVDGKDRLALGSIRGGAVKLTADEEVTTCLGIGEGIETTL